MKNLNTREAVLRRNVEAKTFREELKFYFVQATSISLSDLKTETIAEITESSKSESYKLLSSLGLIIIFLFMNIFFLVFSWCCLYVCSTKKEY